MPRASGRSSHSAASAISAGGGDAAGRDSGGGLFGGDAKLGVALGGHVGRHPAGAERVYGDAAGREREGQCAGETDDTVFGSAVGGLVGDATQAQHRGDVDDPAGGVGQFRQCGFAGVVGAVQVRTDNGVPEGVVVGVQTVGAGNPRAVDQGVDPGQGGEGVLHGFCVSDVAGDETMGRGGGMAGKRSAPSSFQIFRRSAMAAPIPRVPPVITASPIGACLIARCRRRRPAG